MNFFFLHRPLMIVTQKITTLAFQLHDGKAEERMHTNTHTVEATCSHNCLTFKIFFTADLIGKAQVLLITWMMAPFYSNATVNHDSVTVSQHAQYQDHETDAAKWNSAIIHFIK